MKSFNEFLLTEGDIEHYTSNHTGTMTQHRSKKKAIDHAKQSGEGTKVHSVNKRTGYIHSTWDHTGRKMKYVGNNNTDGHWE